MPYTDIDVRDEGGYVLVEANDPADMNHRWWFQETDAGRLVFVCEVLDVAIEPNGRHFLDEGDAGVPTPIRNELSADGHDTIVDTKGRVL